MPRVFAMLLPLVVFAGCGGDSDRQRGAISGDSPSDPQASGEQAESSEGSQGDVQLPDDPFFKEFAYPGATADDTLTMGNATSVWFKTSDDIGQVAEFYEVQFSDGSTKHVEAERAYFMQSKPEGGGYGATVTKQPDGSTQIILKLERP